ncbi:sulfurtransferase [Alteromonadaceae bacterium BrNp21-10]|nr:sulfurtransferase [Alteromonadaceae bacterium BrNp21-10]
MADRLFKECVISVEQLQQHLSHPDLVILHTDMQPIGFEVAQQPQGSIPTAVNVDVDKDISDTTRALPHSLPTEEHFSQMMQQCGVSQNSQVVIYDDYGVYSAPRLWWLLTVMGHKQVSVLNGGLPAWQAAHYSTQTFFSQPESQGDFVATLDKSGVITANVLLQSIQNEQVQVVDARSEDRFYGRVPEPRVGLRQGHIPKAVSLPFQRCLKENNPVNGMLLDKDSLLNLFASKQLSKDNNLAFSCGSGVTACIPLLAATWCGFNNLKLYDGSWSEWGADNGLPIE